MSPFQVLGLTRRASLAEVKRAYAQLLKRHRPDEDPVGFQRIHEAFEACVARCRERDARERETARKREHGLATADAGAAGPERPGPTDDARGHGAQADEEDGSYAFRLPDAEAGPAPDPAQAEFERLHQDVLAHFEHDSPEALEAFLAQDERLVSLAGKRALSARLFQHAVDWLDRDWRRLDVLFRFFEVDSLSDPRLRDDFFARELWLRVRGDERFHAQLAKLRAGRHETTVDRAVIRELLDPPDPARTLLLLAVPGLANRLRQRHDELAAADAQRTEAVVASRMHSLWLPLTDPSRLDWRRFALVYLQATIFCAALVALFAIAAGNDLPKYLRITGFTWLVFALPWTGWTLVRWVWRNYVAWQVGTYGEGDAPAGATLLADRLSVLVLIIVGCVLLIWAVLWRWGGSGFGGLLQGMALLISLRMIAGDSARLRAESYLLCAGAGALAWGLLSRLIGSGDGWDSAVVIPAFGLGTISVVLADHLEARWRHVTPGEARNRLGRIHLLVAAAAALGVYGLVALG